MGSVSNNIVLDTNVLISAILFGGKPRQILELVQDHTYNAILSPMLHTEILEVLVKKFHFTSDKIRLLEELIQENFTIVYPKEIITVVRDGDDNHVLEAAVTGRCSYIITGDRDLLDLELFRNIHIVTTDYFLKNASSS